MIDCWRRFLPVALLLLATFWRFHHLQTQSLWHDEGNSLRLAERSVPDLIEAASHDIHPPGYYLLLKAWITVAGETEFGLRSLSAFWGVVGVAATYALGRLWGLWAAMLAALLVAVNPFAVYYAQETRMYAQLGALSLLSLWLLVKLLDALDNKQHHAARLHRILVWAIGLGVVNGSGLYSHYTYPFTMIAQGVFFAVWWLSHRAWRAAGLYIALNMATLLLFLPWLPTAYNQVSTWPTTGDATPVLDRLDRMFTILVYGLTVGELNVASYVIPVILLLAALFLPAQAWKSALLYTSLPLLLCIISVASLLVSGAYREANLKFLLPAQGATALLIAAGTIRLAFFAGRKPSSLITWAGHGLALMLVGLVIAKNIDGLDRLYHDQTYARSNYRGLVRSILTNARPDNAIILNAPNQQEVFSYYYKGPAPVFPLPRGLGGDDPATQAETEAVIRQYRHIYLILWGQHERDPNSIVENTLNQGAFVVGRQWFNDVELVHYAVLAPPPSEPAHLAAIRFGDNILLQGFALSGNAFKAGAGDVLGVTLFWQSDTVLDRRYKISVQVLGPSGPPPVSQHDSEPANGQLPTTTWQPGQQIIDNHGLVLNPDLPPGEYSLIVVVYNPENPMERLPLAASDSDGSYTLAMLTLE